MECAVSRPLESMGGNSGLLLQDLSEEESEPVTTLEYTFFSLLLLLLGVRLLKKLAIDCRPRLPDGSFSL